eukprot:g76165.t1
MADKRDSRSQTQGNYAVEPGSPSRAPPTQTQLSPRASPRPSPRSSPRATPTHTPSPTCRRMLPDGCPRLTDRFTLDPSPLQTRSGDLISSKVSHERPSASTLMEREPSDIHSIKRDLSTMLEEIIEASTVANMEPSAMLDHEGGSPHMEPSTMLDHEEMNEALAAAHSIEPSVILDHQEVNALSRSMAAHAMAEREEPSSAMLVPDAVDAAAKTPVVAVLDEGKTLAVLSQELSDIELSAIQHREGTKLILLSQELAALRDREDTSLASPSEEDNVAVHSKDASGMMEHEDMSVGSPSMKNFAMMEQEEMNMAAFGQEQSDMSAQEVGPSPRKSPRNAI